MRRATASERASIGASAQQMPERSYADSTHPLSIDRVLLLIAVLVAGRADQRTRTAYPCSLRVCGRWLLHFARVCRYRISKGFSVPSFAYYYRGLRAG